MTGASSYIEEEQLKAQESGRHASSSQRDQVECFHMDEDMDMDMDVNNLGVEEEESSEDDSQPRTRRKVTHCASSSASDATAAAAPSPAEPINSKSVMQSAAEIEQQLNLFRAGNPVLPEGWEYNSRGEPKAKSSLKTKSRSNVIPHHLRVKMTRIEEDSVAVTSEQQRQERLKMTRIEKEPTPDATPPTASGLGVMGGNLRKLLSNQGRQSHLDRFGIQKMILGTDYNSAWEPVPTITELRNQRMLILNRLQDHPSKHFLRSRERGIVQFQQNQPNAQVNWLSCDFAAIKLWSDSVSVVSGHPEHRPLLRVLPQALSASRNAVRLMTTVIFEDHSKRIRFGQYESDGLTFEDLYLTQPWYVSRILAHVSAGSSETVGGFKEFGLYCLYRQTISDVQL